MAMFDPSDFDTEVEEVIEAVPELNLEPEQEQQSLHEAPAADQIDENGSRKRPKMEEQGDEETTLIDRISDLPDGILLHILSLLPSTKEAVRTGALSKRWQFLWTTVPKLLFIKYLFEDSNDEYEEEDTTANFVSNVSQTLIQCRHSKLKAFHVSFEFDSRFAALLNVWIRYAVSRNVEELDLGVDPPLDPPAFDGKPYDLPQNLFSNSSIIDLRLYQVLFMPTRDINWKVLNRLKLWGVKLTEDVIQNILRGSPCLEILEFIYCYGFRRVEITSLSVKKLAIYSHFLADGEDPNVLEVLAPNISSLDIVGDFMSTKLRLVNLQSLVEANVMCHLSRTGVATSQRKAHEELWIGILQSLHHVNTLIVRGECIMALSRLELQGWRAPLSRRKCLQIQSFVRRGGFPGLVNLLESSPELETLTIIGVRKHFEDSCGSYTRKNYLAVQQKSFKCLQLHVKTVRIAFFIQQDRQCELVQFLLENGYALEKIVICVRSLDRKDLNFVSKELPEVTKKLLGCPKASKDALVIFKD